MASLSEMIEGDKSSGAANGKPPVTPTKKTRRVPGRALSGDELDGMLMGLHGIRGPNAPPSPTGRAAGGPVMAPPNASSRRGGKRGKKPSSSTAGPPSAPGLGDFVEEMNASFRNDDSEEKGDHLENMTVDSRQLLANKRGGRRPQKAES